MIDDTGECLHFQQPWGAFEPTICLLQKQVICEN